MIHITGCYELQVSLKALLIRLRLTKRVDPGRRYTLNYGPLRPLDLPDRFFALHALKHGFYRGEAGHRM